MLTRNQSEGPRDAGAPGAVIGASTKIVGRVEGEQDLRVHGRIEGTIRLSETLYVELDGEVAADIEVKVAVIAGKVRGDIKATESVRVTDTGRAVGDIVAPRVILADGAAFHGRIDMGEVETAEPVTWRGDGDRGAVDERP